MKSNIKLKEIYIKSRTCYYFDDIIKFGDFDIDNTILILILTDEKSYKNILVYKVSYETLMGARTLCISFIKQADSLELMMKLDIQYYLELKKYNFIYNKMRYLIGVKSAITYVCYHNYAKIKVDSFDILPLENTIDFS